MRLSIALLSSDFVMMNGPRHTWRRRITEGMSKAEVIRCLKRYVAREVFAVLRNSAPSQSTP